MAYCPPHHPACRHGHETYRLFLGADFDMKKINDGEFKNEKITTTVTMYKDCRRNHAANIGRYAVDGCCEFMPAGDAGSPGALLCAACNCHRNFHKKVVLGSQSTYFSDCSSISTPPK